MGLENLQDLNADAATPATSASEEVKEDQKEETKAATVSEPESEEVKSAAPATTETAAAPENTTSTEVTVSEEEKNAATQSEETKATVNTPNPAATVDTIKSSCEEPEIRDQDSTEGTQATTQAMSEKSEEEEEQGGKYMLLDRLFKFIKTTDDEPVNLVLAGYFSKVVQLLINRKQKQIVPYIIADENKVVVNLLRHVYSRSIAEVIHRILHIVESNFEEEVSTLIAAQKQLILSSLIDQLATEREDETIMNAAFILQDILEQKAFFQILTKRHNMQKMFDIAFPETKSANPDGCFVTQGLIARFVQQFNDRQKQSVDEDRWNDSGDDDDIIVNEMSDEDNEDSKNNQALAVVEILVKTIGPIKTILMSESQEPIKNSFTQGRILPLGKTKLRAVELLQSIVSLKKATIITAVSESCIMETIL